VKMPDANDIHRTHGAAALRSAIDTGALSKEDAQHHVIAFRGRKDRFILFSEIETKATKDWLVDGFLGADETSSYYGKPGDGKSVLVEDMALHIAAGRNWHGRKVKQGAVVYVALERKKLVERRAIAFRQEHGLTDLPFAIVGGVHDFRDPEAVFRLAELVREVEAVTGQPVILIVIDTLSRALCGGDENSPKDMGAIVHATGVLQERTGAHILWVHHTPLDGAERMRGHGALLGALDTTVHVARSGALRTATVIKANDAEDGTKVAFALKSVVIGVDQDGQETMAPVVVPSEYAPPRLAKSGSMPKAAQTALRALTEAIAEQGSQAPASDHIPSSARVVTMSTWRQQSYRRGISGSDEQRAKEQAFKRASEYLIGVGRVGVWDDQVWLIG
jgi:AAA domain